MADNVAITAGSGTDVATNQVTGTGEHVQLVKLAYSANGSRTLLTADANGLLVDLGTNNDVTVTGSVTANAGTNLNTSALALEATQGSVKTAVELIDDGIATVASAITAKGMAAVGTDGTNARILKTDTSGELQVDVLSLPALAASTNNIGDVDVLTVNGVAPAFGTGVRGSTVQRVTVATDDVVPASQSGTWTVQPGNTANTTPWLVTQTPATSGGLTTYHLVSAATTNATNIKNSAGQVYGWYIQNNNAAMRKVAFHNSASTPTAGASVFFSLSIPASSAANVSFPNGIPFSSGIGITTVTEQADSGTTAVASGDLNINIFYK